MLPATSIEQRASHSGGNDRVVVAVRAEKEISKAALAWALTHVVQPGDSVILLAVLPDETANKISKRFWNFPRLSGDCGSSQREGGRPLTEHRVCQVSEYCSQMVLQFHNRMEVGVKVKVVSGKPDNVVMTESRRSGANWVVLDKKLKQELKNCMEELQCNIVLMKGSRAKILRLNLGCSNEVQTPYYSASSSPGKEDERLQGHRLKHSTSVSSPDEPCSSNSRISEGSLFPCDSTMPLLTEDGHYPLFQELTQKISTAVSRQNCHDGSPTTFDSKGLVTVYADPMSYADYKRKNFFWIPENHIVENKTHPDQIDQNNGRQTSPSSRNLLDKFSQHDAATRAGKFDLKQSPLKDYVVCSSLRSSISLGRTSSMPPPLCSNCQHKAPIFGKPPRKFSYEELEVATEGFSKLNFLAKGGFGVVYKGILKDGQVIAVKLLKSNGSETDADFCREVGLLSCAQHRNIVLLIGFCTVGIKKILVYEYICNKSLEFHLHGDKRFLLDWHLKLKIAIGIARGLRYLHEDCRAGCIIHRDLRPKNILVTHDFMPLIADFGLARWQSEWSIVTGERLIGASGYLAPEYVNRGKITWAVDVYAFGVVLLELMTGRRIKELWYKEQHLLSDRFHPLAALEPNPVLRSINELLDPSLTSEQLDELSCQLRAMVEAASLCLCQDPECRPPMSKILRILEGGDLRTTSSLDIHSVGNRSGHLRGLISQKQTESRIRHSRQLSQ